MSDQERETKYPRWVMSNIKKRINDHEYTRAGTKTNQLKLSGALHRWNGEYQDYTVGKIQANDMTIYVPSIRLAGQPKEILNLLEANQEYNKEHYTDAKTFFEKERNKCYYSYFTVTEGQGHFKQSIKDSFDQELKEYEKYKNSGASSKNIIFHINNLDYIHSTIKSIKADKNKVRRAPARRSNASRNQGGQRKTLIKRIKEVYQEDGQQYGKFIDVDSMKDDGSGAKYLKPTLKSKKLMANHPLAPPVLASKPEKYRRAMEILDEEKYENGEFTGRHAEFADAYNRGERKSAAIETATTSAPTSKKEVTYQPPTSTFTVPTEIAVPVSEPMSVPTAVPMTVPMTSQPMNNFAIPVASTKAVSPVSLPSYVPSATSPGR